MPNITMTPNELIKQIDEAEAEGIRRVQRAAAGVRDAAKAIAETLEDAPTITTSDAVLVEAIQVSANGRFTLRCEGIGHNGPPFYAELGSAELRAGQYRMVVMLVRRGD